MKGMISVKRINVWVLLAAFLASLVGLTVADAQLSGGGSVRIRDSANLAINLGVQTVANSLSVTFPAAQTLAVTQSGVWTVQPGNTANTTAWLVTGTGGTFPITQAAFTSLVTGQQAVTTSAVALTTNTASRVCVKVLSAGTQTIYFGPAGVTTGTGQELQPGDGWCGAVSNTDKIFVIAGGAGSSVAWDALN